MPTGLPEMHAMVNQVMFGSTPVYQVMAQGAMAGVFATMGAAMAAVAMLQPTAAISMPPKPKGVLDWMPED